MGGFFGQYLGGLWPTPPEASCVLSGKAPVTVRFKLESVRFPSSRRRHGGGNPPHCRSERKRPTGFHGSSEKNINIDSRQYAASLFLLSIHQYHLVSTAENTAYCLL